jgi:uncharacterized protein YeaO (DUF488 family)/DNA-binding MarR family transcriptional regulator
LPDATYARLLTLRTGLRRFEHWSAQQARAAGLTPMQHQLLLAVRGHRDAAGPTIGDVADALLVRHHSAVGLVDRAVSAGLVTRARDSRDQRVVRLRLTAKGALRLERLSTLHLEELSRLAGEFSAAWADLAPPAPRLRHGPRHLAVEVARAYELGPTSDAGEVRVLVDRLWPRGLSKDRAQFSTWTPDVAPSTALRKWYGHAPERFEEFAARYRRELASGRAGAALGELARRAGTVHLVLVTATRDVEHSGAAVLRDLLVGGA